MLEGIDLIKFEKKITAPLEKKIEYLELEVRSLRADLAKLRAEMNRRLPHQ